MDLVDDPGPGDYTWRMPNPRLAALGGLAALALATTFVSRMDAASAPAPTGDAARQLLPRPFDQGWRFGLGENPGAESPGFDDRAWRPVDLPHDWSIEGPAPGVGPHDKATPGGQSTGYLPGGTGWYRNHFAVDPDDAGRQVDLIFDGVQQDSDVWVNGTHLGFQPHGYIAFHYAVGPYLKSPGQDNVIAVRAVNPNLNSRWYPGSGLYREVSMRVHDSLYVPVFGARVDTVWLFGEKALLQVRLEIRNDRPAAEDVTAEVTLTDPDGAVTVRPLGQLRVSAGRAETINQSVPVEGPKPWSPENPRLYGAEFRIMSGGRVVDVYRQPFGIRTVSVSPEKGLLVNGSPVKLRGACLHHDNGLLGAAAFPDAESRRVALMKRSGFNAIRTSHNPPSSAFLDACDRAGMLVVDEFADSWELPKVLNGYQRYFDGHWEQDLGAMLARDFNHPSVIIWSIGNEIPERANPVGLEIGRRLADTVRQVDARRPVTNAICGFYDNPELEGQWDPTAPAFAFLDVGGYNYTWANYQGDHAKFPRRVMMGTESFPREAFENWREIDRDAYVLGDFVWTGMDYIGESGIGHTGYVVRGDDPKSGQATWAQMPWPWWIAWCGDIDITGNKKAQSYYRDIVWGVSPLELAVHEPVPEGMEEKVGLWGWPSEFRSWNWSGAEGKPLAVNVYSRASSVRLELNGRQIGEKAIDPEKGITAAFTVPYEPGVLRASALDKGRVVATCELVTTGRPAALRLAPEARSGPIGRDSLVYVPVEVVDAKGSLVPEATVPLGISVEGPAQLQAFGSANPTDLSPLGDGKTESFRGRALAILRSTGKPGRVTVRVSGEGLGAASAEVEMGGAP